jgi:hypothetical protein
MGMGSYRKRGELRLAIATTTGTGSLAKKKVGVKLSYRMVLCYGLHQMGLGKVGIIVLL